MVFVRVDAEGQVMPSTFYSFFSAARRVTDWQQLLECFISVLVASPSFISFVLSSPSGLIFPNWDAGDVLCGAAGFLTIPGAWQVTAAELSEQFALLHRLQYLQLWILTRP